MPNYKIGVEVDANTGNSAKELKGVSGAIDSLDDAFGGGIKNAGAFGVTLGDLMSPVGLVTTGVAALTTALIATGAQAMQLAGEVEGSTALMQTQLGLTDEKAVAFEDTMRSIYTNNYGESFEDIAASMVAVEQQLGRIGGSESQEQLQAITEQAIAFGDAFGTDVGESTGAAVTLMENFGLTATQAFDFLVAGQQKGLDSSGDLLDTIGEYSVQFSQGGASAAEFFNILEAGNAGGVLGTDKVADAFKEFSIRIMDDSTTTKTALDGIGVSYDTLKQGFADGSVTTIEAMQLVIDKINEIEDPVERNKAGVALFGTQWEDLTETVITEIDTQKTALSDLEGAAATLGEQYEKTGVEGEEAMRAWNNALVDVGDELNALKDFVLPGFTLLLNTIVIPAIELFVMWLKDVKGIAESIGGALDWLGLIPDAPEAQSSSLPVAPYAVQSMTPAFATASAGVADGNGVVQHFYIERGDPDVVRESASLGIDTAARARGW